VQVNDVDHAIVHLALSRPPKKLRQREN
jgi:hypothetical protein